MKKPFIFISGIVGIIVILSVVQVIVSNRLSTTGITLNKIQNQLKMYKTQNIVLSEKLLELSSLSTIASAASQMGFVEAKTHYVLTAPLPVARKQ